MPPAPTPLETTRELYQQARVAATQYRWPEVGDLLDGAAKLLSEVPDADRFELALRCGVLGTWLTFDQFGLASALTDALRWEHDAQERHRDDLAAIAATQAGVLCARHGALTEALVHMRRARPLGVHLPPDERVRMLLNKGAIASQAGRLREASEDLGAASDLAIDAGLTPFAFMARHNQGYVEYLRGDLPTALLLMTEADELPVDIDRGVSRLDRARVLLEVGLVDDAVVLLGEAIDDLRHAGMAPEQADAELDLARCQVLRLRLPDAMALAQGVAQRAAARGEVTREIEARLVVLEIWITAAKRGDGTARELGVERQQSRADAFARHDEALALAEVARSAGLVRVAQRAEVAAGLIDARMGNLDAAASELARARGLGRSTHVSHRTLLARADMFLAQARGDAAAAARVARRVRTDIARAGRGMASLDLRTATSLHVARVVELDMARAASVGRPWLLLQVAEAWRTALGVVPAVRPSASEDVAALWARLRVLHDEQRAAEADQQSALRREIAEVEMGLRRASWAGGSDASVDRGSGRIDRELVDAALRRESAALLSLQWVDNDLVGVLVRPGRPAGQVVLGRRDELLALTRRVAVGLEAAARAPAGPLGAVVRSSLAADLAALDTALLSVVDADALVVLPTGSLAALPWGLLPSRRGLPTTVAGSLVRWLDAGVTVGAGARVAAVAGADVVTGADEVAAVLHQWAGSTEAPMALVSDPASVHEAYAGADLLHVAAHGRHRADNPLFSSVLLGAGPLFAHELEGLPRRVSHAVLSACRAGGVTVRPGDQPLGFTASLLSFGVACVVAPVCDVPDEVADVTMRRYHEALVSGRGAAEALASATERSASEGHPLAAAFTCFGSPWKYQRPSSEAGASLRVPVRRVTRGV